MAFSLTKQVGGQYLKPKQRQYLRLSREEDNPPISFPSLGLPLLPTTPPRADKILLMFIVVLFLQLIQAEKHTRTDS